MTPPNTRLRIEIAPETEVGVYANFVSIWHDADTFTLDFVAVTRQPTPSRGLDDRTARARCAGPRRQSSSGAAVPGLRDYEGARAAADCLRAGACQAGRGFD